MECNQSAAVVHELKTLFNIGVIRELTDGQLLERFATDRGEAAELAFAVLVERHGPMVLRVCRTVLGGEFDSDDAFQATFLVLVQKARGLWVRDSLGPWLHQVAFRAASRARLAAARRRKHEEHAAANRSEAHTMKNDDLDGFLHAEIEKLPERYRAPVVLCDLEGCSHQQAARYLGWPVGTVKSRQARGREKLRDRLRRQGVVPNVALLGSGSLLVGPNHVVPPALVESTICSVVQFVTCQTAVKASTLSLAQGVLKAMSISRSLQTGSILFALGATVSGAGIYAQRQAPAPRLNTGTSAEATTRADEPLTLRVTPGRLDLTIISPARLEMARTHDAFCDIEGGTSIIMIKPEGTFVTKGELVCELDSAALRDQLTNTRIAIKSAEVDYQNATAAREVAEIAAREFLEGSFKNELNARKGEVALAESAIQRAERGLERARRARQQVGDLVASKKSAVSPADILAELDIDDRIDAGEQTISREKAALELARSRQSVLENFTRDRTLKALSLEARQKRPDELAKRNRYQLEQSKARKLERQIEACAIKAPVDGTVVYAPAPRGRGNQGSAAQIEERQRLERAGLAVPSGNQGPAAQIEEGAQLRERQKIFSVIDPNGQKRVTAKVREAKVDHIKRGMKARIRIDGFPGQSFNGTVDAVSALPDAAAITQGDSKVYTTHLLFDNEVPGLRPGIVAEVEFLLADRDNALAVPLQAILRYEGKPHVAIRKPGGAIELREVSVGPSGDKLVEITRGIESGDDVVLNPAAFLSDRPKPPAATSPTSSESSRTPPEGKP